MVLQKFILKFNSKGDQFIMTTNTTNVKELTNTKCFARMTVTAKVLPLQKNAPLIGTYGQNNKEMLLCYAGCGTYGFVTLKAVGNKNNPNFHKELGFKMYDTVQISGVIEEREKTDKNQGFTYDRTLKIINAEKVKVVDPNSEKMATGKIQGVIDSLSEGELIVAILSKPEYGVKKIHLTLNGSNDCKWIQENLVIGDMVCVTADHINRVNKDQEGNFVNKENYLMVDQVVGFKKMG
jgi:hypothetical protein